MYHFLSGYTAKVAGTEKGVGTEPQATFSTCFGAPFMPRHPSVYGNMLRELIARHNVDCWLVNTGWTGGKYGVGRRMPIKATRALLDAALSGALKRQPMRTDPLFGFQVPIVAAGRRARHPQPARDLGRQGRLRRPGARAGRHVQQELRQVRGARRRRRQGRRPGAAAGGGVVGVLYQDLIAASFVCIVLHMTIALCLCGCELWLAGSDSSATVRKIIRRLEFRRLGPRQDKRQPPQVQASRTQAPYRRSASDEGYADRDGARDRQGPLAGWSDHDKCAATSPSSARSPTACGAFTSPICLGAPPRAIPWKRRSRTRAKRCASGPRTRLTCPTPARSMTCASAPTSGRTSRPAAWPSTCR